MSTAEPMTMVTDFLLGAASFGLGVHLLQKRGRVVAAFAFFAIALAAFVGGAYHGLLGSFDEPGLAPLFRVSLIAIGVSNFLLVIAVLRVASNPNRPQWIVILTIKLCAYLVWVARTVDFHVAIYDYAVTVAAILWLARSAPPAFVRPVRAGILVSLAASAVQIGHVAPTASFNHNDLYHVIQIGAVVLFHRAFAHSPLC